MSAVGEGDTLVNIVLILWTSFCLLLGAVPDGRAMRAAPGALHRLCIAGGMDAALHARRSRRVQKARARARLLDRMIQILILPI